MKNTNKASVIVIALAMLLPLGASAGTIYVTGDSNGNAGLFFVGLYRYTTDINPNTEIYDHTDFTQSKRDAEKALVDAGLTDPETAPNFHHGPPADYTFQLDNATSGSEFKVTVYDSFGNKISDVSISGLDPTDPQSAINAFDAFFPAMDQNLKDLGYPGGLTTPDAGSTLLLLGIAFVPIALRYLKLRPNRS